MAKRVLIIEDEPLASKALEKKFMRSGFDTHTALSGEDAVALLCKEQFDVVLSDLVLQNKMGGHDVIAWMREKGMQTPVIILSNLCAPEDIARSKELGAVEHFLKSMTPMHEVVDFVSKVVSA